jgi:hypothetical protein
MTGRFPDVVNTVTGQNHLRPSRRIILLDFRSDFESAIFRAPVEMAGALVDAV